MSQIVGIKSPTRLEKWYVKDLFKQREPDLAYYTILRGKYQDDYSLHTLIMVATELQHKQALKFLLGGYDISYNDYQLILHCMYMIEVGEEKEYHRRLLAYIKKHFANKIAADSLMAAIKTKADGKYRQYMMFEVGCWGFDFATIDDLDWQYGIL